MAARQRLRSRAVGAGVAAGVVGAGAVATCCGVRGAGLFGDPPLRGVCSAPLIVNLFFPGVASSSLELWLPRHFFSFGLVLPYGDVRDERASLEVVVLGREARLFAAFSDSCTPNRSSVITLAADNQHVQRSRIVARIPA